MLGNDNYGDCVLAGAAHETMLWNAEAKHPVTFTDKDVLSDYTAITGFDPDDPNSDQGTDMQAAASYRRKTGMISQNGARHTVDAYLGIDTGDLTQLKSSIYLFSAAGVGIQFPESAMTQFTKGKPWTVVKNSPIEGGHYIPAIGYDSCYIYVVTWGKIQKMAWSFYSKYNDESIAYLSLEYLATLSPEGFDLATLRNDLNAL